MSLPHYFTVHIVVAQIYSPVRVGQYVYVLELRFSGTTWWWFKYDYMDFASPQTENILRMRC